MIPSIIGRKKSSVAGSGAHDILIQICGFRFIAILASAFLKPKSRKNLVAVQKILDSAGVPLLLNRTRLNFLKEGLMKSFILYPSAHGARAGI
ncbi:hypothetical protein [Acidocella facilis]|uniref:hypothetical protein n=1 Tax=Acidocella facilis TaxID=525 RepID=UPI0012DFE8D1|nr:hypothetical protein [Acidocella facilis]